MIVTGFRLFAALLLVLLSLLPTAQAMSNRYPPVLRWVYMADAEPINWEENGIAKGLEVEIVEQVAKSLGIRVEHLFYPWARAQMMVASGQADGMITTPTPTRFQYAVFGREMVIPEYCNVFVRKGNDRIINEVSRLDGLEDLRHYELLDFVGNGWTEAFMSWGYTIHKVPKLEQLPSMLAAGRHDLVVSSSSWMNWWINKKNLQNQIVEIETDWPNTRIHFVAMLSRKSPWLQTGLLRAIDEEVARMKRTGQWQALLRKYKNPHGFGKPFRSHLDAAYEAQHRFYTEYDQYPAWVR